jgi:hypothetical protein
MASDQDIRDGGPISPGFVKLIARNGASPDFVRRATAIARGEKDPDASRFPALRKWVSLTSRLTPVIACVAALIVTLFRHLAD